MAFDSTLQADKVSQDQESELFRAFTSKGNERAPRRWNYFKDRLIERFGEIVYKVGVDAGFDCPNRDGSKGYGGCAYCSQIGSLAPNQDPSLDIPKQIDNGRRFTRRRYGAEKHIVYFQAFTNTYAPVDVLRKRYEAALLDENIVGISVGTRPDCIDEEKADLLAEFAQKRPFFTVELGLQSKFQNRLSWVNRLEDTDDYIRAMQILRDRKIDVVTHVILGFPEESRQDMSETVELAEECGTTGIKLQMLHIIRKTKLGVMYQRNPFELMSFEEYGELLIHLVERLSPRIELHRITGETDDKSLMAPDWVRQKTRFFAWFEEELAKRQTWQGRLSQSRL